MAHSNIDSIEVREKKVYDGRKPLKVLELYVDNCRRAVVQEQLNGSLYFRFDPVGVFHWQEARVWLQGLLELAVNAEELERDTKKSK